MLKRDPGFGERNRNAGGRVSKSKVFQGMGDMRKEFEQRIEVEGSFRQHC